jgi:hypothetical protein
MPIVSIPLTQGKTAIIDEADLPIIAPYKWRAVRGHGDIWYAKATVSRPDGSSTTIFMHRLIDGASRGVQVDHEDHDGLNNRRSNLRRCSQHQNLQNMRKKSTNTSGYIGVSRDKKRWCAQIAIDGRHIHIGSFDDPESAARARDAKAIELRGEFAVLNFPRESS